MGVRPGGKGSAVVAACILVAVSVGLLGCGPFGDDTEEQVTDVITTYLTDNDPAFCTELLTEDFVEENFKSQKKCEKAMEDSSGNVDSVEVSNFQELSGNDIRPSEAEGGSEVAQLEVDVVGPPVGEFGKHFLVNFEKQDGDWKILNLETSL